MSRPALIALSGAPGVGKSTIARILATNLGAMRIRIDVIEQSLRDAGVDVIEQGYRVGYALAEDNLRLGRIVIADSVNPIAITREAWRAAALRAGAPCLDVELICSDASVHRSRVEGRTNEIAGLVQPDWGKVQARVIEPWAQPRLLIDTALQQPEASAAAIITALEELGD